MLWAHIRTTLPRQFLFTIFALLAGFQLRNNQYWKYDNQRVTIKMAHHHGGNFDRG